MESNNIIDEFIKESNAIERVYDDVSFHNAKRAWDYLDTHEFMSPELVKNVHDMLMDSDTSWSEPKLKSKYRGVFRDCPVYIGGHEAMKAEVVGSALMQWCYSMNSTSKREGTPDELEQVSRDLHVEYEGIHPFIDGNGRTGRMFMNWWRVRAGLPVLAIHEGEEQMAYYKWFKQ